MRDEEFEWDDGKAGTNFEKHGVTFDLARAAFDDPGHVEVEDPDPNELRFKRICRFETEIFVVSYTERGTRIRIISARLANRNEQKTYINS